MAFLSLVLGSKKLPSSERFRGSELMSGGHQEPRKDRAHETGGARSVTEGEFEIFNVHFCFLLTDGKVCGKMFL